VNISCARAQVLARIDAPVLTPEPLAVQNAALLAFIS